MSTGPLRGLAVFLVFAVGALPGPAFSFSPVSVDAALSASCVPEAAPSGRVCCENQSDGLGDGPAASSALTAEALAQGQKSSPLCCRASSGGVPIGSVPGIPATTSNQQIDELGLAASRLVPAIAAWAADSTRLDRDLALRAALRPSPSLFLLDLALLI